MPLAKGVMAVFTTRAGGVSGAPFASSNLALHVGDDDDAVLANRASTAAVLGVKAERTVWCEQVHGDVVATVTEDDAGRGATSHDDAIAGADGLVTDVQDLPLAVLAADCAPVLFAAPHRGIVAAVHAGRRGLVDAVLEIAVGTMLDLGADRADIVAAVGPSIGPCCYAVGDDVAAEVNAAVPATRAKTTDGRTALNLSAGIRAVLAREGVHAVTTVGGCTAHQPGAYFSYRRDGVTGRQAGIVWRT
ncbi:MAG: purine-nucleoside/S-methyl-5-thioadenosine phosphorylase / adenosine deaminase [Frankiaceae bacterium]|nr:purine-nucleoside/S-methyl-5-thioadenosine phosphorylase / adenosine deaminase [Frankiaceae bacterium]